MDEPHAARAVSATQTPISKSFCSYAVVNQSGIKTNAYRSLTIAIPHASLEDSFTDAKASIVNLPAENGKRNGSKGPLVGNEFGCHPNESFHIEIFNHSRVTKVSRCWLSTTDLDSFTSHNAQLTDAANVGCPGWQLELEKAKL